MANATAVVSKRGREQFQGLFTDFWAVKATINADSLNTGANDTDTVTVPGVALGDIVLGVSLGVDLAGVQLTAYVSAANTVTVIFENITAGTALVGDGTMAAVVDRRDAQIYIADQHSDFFVRNIFVMLAEERVALPVFRPAAFAKVTLATWS